MSDDNAIPVRRMTLADYDAAQKSKASATGQPVLRMSGPALPYSSAVSPDGTSAVFFWIQNDRLVYAGSGDSGPRQANASVIASIFEAPGQQLVAVDRPAEKRIMRVLDQGAASADAGKRRLVASAPDHTGTASQVEVPVSKIADTARQVKFAMTLPVCSRFFTLTAVLTRKFYLPTGKSPLQINDWRSAFGLDNSFGALRVLLMTAMASAHERQAKGTNAELTKSFLTAETSAINSVAYRGVAAAASAYLATERLSESWHSIERTDPVLRHRAVIDGSVARLSTLVRIDSQIHGVVSQPFKLREGDVIIMADDMADARIQNATLVGTTCDEELMAALSPSKVYESAGQFAFVDAALAAHDSILVTAKPFGGVARMGSARRWSSKFGNGYDKVDEHGNRPSATVSRDVPVDVILAGQPQV